MGKRFRNCDLNQRLLLPPSLEDWSAGIIESGRADAAQAEDAGRAGGVQAAQGDRGTGVWTDQRGARVSEISAARTGESVGRMEADLRHAQSAEALPLRMEPPERLKAVTEPAQLTFRAALPESSAQIPSSQDPAT